MGKRTFLITIFLIMTFIVSQMAGLPIIITGTTEDSNIRATIDNNSNLLIKVDLISIESINVYLDLDQNNLFSTEEQYCTIDLSLDSSTFILEEECQLIDNSSLYLEYFIFIKSSTVERSVMLKIFKPRPLVLFQFFTNIKNSEGIKERGLSIYPTHHNNFGEIAFVSTNGGDNQVDLTEEESSLTGNGSTPWLSCLNTSNNIMTGLTTRSLNDPSCFPEITTDKKLSLTPFEVTEEKNIFQYEALLSFDRQGNSNYIKTLAEDFTNYNSFVDKNELKYNGQPKSSYFIGSNNSAIWNEKITITVNDGLPYFYLKNRRIAESSTKILIATTCQITIAYNEGVDESFSNNPQQANYKFYSSNNGYYSNLTMEIDFYDGSGFDESNYMAKGIISFILCQESSAIIIRSTVIKQKTNLEQFYFMTANYYTNDISPDYYYNGENIYDPSDINYGGRDYNIGGFYSVGGYSWTIEVDEPLKLDSRIGISENTLDLNILSPTTDISVGTAQTGYARMLLLPDAGFNNFIIKKKNQKLLSINDPVITKASDFTRELLLETGSRVTSSASGDYDGDGVYEFALGFIDEDGSNPIYRNSILVANYLQTKSWDLTTIGNDYHNPYLLSADITKRNRDYLIVSSETKEISYYHYWDDDFWQEVGYKYSTNDKDATKYLLTGIIGDFDNDPDLEFFNDGKCYDYTQGELLYCKNYFDLNGDEYLINIDNDTNDEILSLIDLGYYSLINIVNADNEENPVISYSLEDYSSSNEMIVNVAIIDLNNDNIDEILLAVNGPEPTSYFTIDIYEINNNEIEKNGTLYNEHNNKGIYEIYCLDIDFDGQKEIFYTNYHGSGGVILDRLSTTDEWLSSTFDTDHDGSFTEFGDFTGDGLIDFIMGTWPNGQVILFAKGQQEKTGTTSYLTTSNSEASTTENNQTNTSSTIGSALNIVTPGFTINILLLNSMLILLLKREKKK